MRDPFLAAMLQQFAKDELRHYKLYQQFVARRIQRDPKFRRVVLKVFLKATSPLNQVSGGPAQFLIPPGDCDMAFADNLKQLPPITHLAALELLDQQGQVVATIENKPGKAGSLAVYAALAARHGSIDAAAAREGLALFAEHTEDARLHQIGRAHV